MPGQENEDGPVRATERRTSVFAVALAAVAPAAVAAALLNLSSCSRIPSEYFRVTAHLMHGDEPVTIDWVVECRYAKGAGEMRAYVRGTVVPYVFGVTTKDGGMVLMVAPAYCGKKETNTDYLPFLMWGDRSGDFSFFTAYVSQAAYRNPSWQLRILDVNLRPSDEAERDRWKKTAPKNVVPASQSPFLDDSRGAEATCLGFARVPIPASFDAKVAEAQPQGDPAYWIADEELGIAIAAAAHALVQNPFQLPISEGLDLREMEAQYPFDTYPEGDRAYLQRHYNGPDRQSTVGIDVVPIDTKKIGMMSCGAMPFDPKHHGLVVFKFPDGSTPPLALNKIDLPAIVAGNQTLFYRRRAGFDIERGGTSDE